MPGAGVPLGPPLAFSDLTFVWSVIALVMLAVLAGVLWIRRSRNNGIRGDGRRTNGHERGRRPRPRVAA